MPSVYIETSIISYLRPEPANHVVTAARQVLTRQWWDEDRTKYQLVTSQFVLDEAARGNKVLAEERLRHLAAIPLPSIDPDVRKIGNAIMALGQLPLKAEVDSLHTALAGYHSVDYLLTRNCSHIANARLMPKVSEVLADFGLALPLIYTPNEMVDDNAPQP